MLHQYSLPLFTRYSLAYPLSYKDSQLSEGMFRVFRSILPNCISFETFHVFSTVVLSIFATHTDKQCSLTGGAPVPSVKPFLYRVSFFLLFFYLGTMSPAWFFNESTAVRCSRYGGLVRLCFYFLYLRLPLALQKSPTPQ